MLNARRAAWLVGMLVLGCGGVEAPPAPPPVVEAVPSDPPPAEPPPAAPPETPTDPDWVEKVAIEAVEWEIMPGTTAEENPERPAQLRKFFLAHPEYADPKRREVLADMACAFGVEAGHERLAHPEPKTPLVVDVTGPKWRLVVAHADGWCTSDDWSYFTNSVGVAVAAKGVTYGYAGAAQDAVVVRRDGVEIARQPLVGQGYLMLAEGRPAAEADHDMVDGVLTEASRYFGEPFSEP